MAVLRLDGEPEGLDYGRMTYACGKCGRRRGGVFALAADGKVRDEATGETPAELGQDCSNAPRCGGWSAMTLAYVNPAAAPACKRCGGELPPRAGPGRPRAYCLTCRPSAWHGVGEEEREKIRAQVRRSRERARARAGSATGVGGTPAA